MPFTYDFPGIVDARKKLLIQESIAEVSVKAINKSILCRLAGLDNPQLHSILKDQLIQHAEDILWALSSSCRSQIGTKHRNAVQNTMANPRSPCSKTPCERVS